MAVTKRPKKVIVTLREVTKTVSGYNCPSCTLNLIGGGISKNVSRFKCEQCGQELIVDKFVNEK